MKKLLPIGLELIGVAAVGSGIGIELITGAGIGLVVITVGSCFVAMGGIIWGKFVRSSRK